MKTYISISIITALLCVFSCQKDDKTFTGPPLVAFTKQTINDTILYMETHDTTLSIPIQLEASPQSSAKSVIIETFGTNSAVLGTHYVYNSDTVIFPIGKLFASFTITLKSENFSEGDTASVTFSISDKSSIEPSANYKTCKVHIIKQSFLGMFVRKYSCYEPKSQKTYTTSFVAGMAAGTILNTNFWCFPGVGQYVSYIISKTATSVVIPSQNWYDQSGLEYRVSGKGTYNNNGSMTVNYILKMYPDTTKIYENGIDYFTPVN